MSTRYSKVILLLALISLVASSAVAVEVWAGRTYSFTRANGADPLDPASQDAITPTCILTRNDTQGLYNIAQEAAPDNWGIGSPIDCMFAMGNAEDWQSLSFGTWLDFCAGWPCYDLVGFDGCMWIVSEDIYIDFRFDSWTCSGGGGCAWTRGVGATPVDESTLSLVKALY